MTKGKTIAAVALAGMSAYLLFIRRSSLTGLSPFEELTSRNATSVQNLLPAKGPGNMGPDATAPSIGTQAIGLIGAGSAAVAALFGVGGTTAAAGAAGVTAATGGTTAAATAGGIGTAATIGITAGIAGGVLLTWAVWKKGLFRGGEEALLVNPDRDQFLLQFGPRWQGEGKGGPTWEQSGNGRLAAILFEGGDTSQRLWTALAQADHIDEFLAATREIQSFLAARGISIQAP